MLATAPQSHCDACGTPRTHHGRGLCRDCFSERQRARGMPIVICANCDMDAPNRGRGLCPRCYQYAWRTGAMPPPNRTTVEEVWGSDDGA